METSDQRLLQDWCNRRDARAFQSIVQRHTSMVFHTALRILRNRGDAEDVTQTCFETLVKVREPGKIRSLGAWFHGMATNLSLNHLRTISRRKKREHRYVNNKEESEQGDSWEEILPHIDEAIRSLEDSCRYSIVAHFLEGRTHAEIAKDMEVSRSTVSRNIDKGVKQVEVILKKKGVVPGAALGPFLASQLSSATVVEASLLASLGKLALVQGQGASILGQTLIAKATLITIGKFSAAAALIFLATTIGVSKYGDRGEQADAEVPEPVNLVANQVPDQSEENAVESPAQEAASPPASLDNSTTTEVDSTTVHVSGYVQNSAADPVAGSKVKSFWATGYKTVVTDEQGRFKIPVPRNTFGNGDLLIIRKLTYEDKTHDVPFRAEVHGDTLSGWLESKFGLFPVSGKRTGKGKGAFGTWDVVTEFKDNNKHPGVLTFERNEDGLVEGLWVDDLGPSDFDWLEVPNAIILSANIDDFRTPEKQFELTVDGRDDIELTVLQTASVSGLVVDSNGSTLPRWIVYVRNGNELEGTETDDSGRYTLTDIMPGAIKIQAQGRDGTSKAMSPYPVTLNQGEHLRGLNLVYDLAGSVFGRIMDDQGKPIENAEVWTWLTPEPLFPVERKKYFLASSDAAGRYEVTGIPDDRDVKIDIQVKHKNYRTKRRYGYFVDGTDLDFVLIRQPKVSGHVLDAVTREPIVEYRRYAWIESTPFKERGGDFFGAELRRYTNGEFSFPQIGYGTIGIAVSAPGYHVTRLRLENVRPGEVVDNLEFLLERATPIQGIVLDPKRNPVENARITLGLPVNSNINDVDFKKMEGQMYTDSRGEFVIDEYPKDLSLLSAYRTGFAPSWFEIASYHSRVEIVLEEGGRIEGKVTYGNEPLKNDQSWISFYVDGSPVLFAKTDDTGKYVITNVPLGPVTIRPSRSGEQTFQSIERDAWLDAGGSLRQDFHFETGNTSFLKGTVYLDGEPVHRAGVRASLTMKNGDRTTYGTRVAKDGTYTLGPIPGGSYQIRIGELFLENSSPFYPPDQTVIVNTSGITSYDFKLVSN